MAGSAIIIIYEGDFHINHFYSSGDCEVTFEAFFGFTCEKDTKEFNP
jgi:hypothetical protein